MPPRLLSQDQLSLSLSRTPLSFELLELCSYQELRTQTPHFVLSKVPKLNLDLISLARVLWLNFFAASAGLVTLGTSAAGLSFVAGRSRRGFLRAPLVWLDRFGDWIHCSPEAGF